MVNGMLDGKVVIITGAGGGLGRSYAQAVARAGGRVLVSDIDADAAELTAEAIRSEGGAAFSHQGDVGVPADARALIDASVSRFGALHGLVNNAGILSPGAARDQSPEQVSRALATNVQGPWYCAVAAMDAMTSTGGGSILNVVSGAAQGLENLPLYGTTKAAVLGMTYGLALEVAGSGIRVNAISPLARTPMSALMDIDDRLRGDHPDLIAPAVVYLLSDASRALNGQIVRFDGHRLGVLAAPQLAATTGPSDWTAESVAAAFEGTLAHYRQPVGLASAPRPDDLQP